MILNYIMPLRDKSFAVTVLVYMPSLAKPFYVLQVLLFKSSLSFNPWI
jgi:hypothetical protein